MTKTIKVLSLLLALAMILCSCGKSTGFSDGLDESGYFKDIKATD